MTDKVTLTPIGTFVNDTTAVNTYNNNLTTITSGFDGCLFLNGTAPNQMQSTLDMNSNRIINLPAPGSITEPARLQDVVTNPTITVPPTGTSGATVPYLNGNNTWSGTQTFNAAVTLPSNSITSAEFRQSAAKSVVGNSTNATANVADIAGTANQVLIVNSAGTSLGFGQVNLASASAITGILPGANGGSLVLLNTLTSGYSDTTSLTSTYTNYLVTLDNIVLGSTTNLGIEIQSGGAFKTSGYLSICSAMTASYVGTTNTSYIGTTIGQDSGGTVGACGHFYVYKPSATAFCIISGQTSYIASSVLTSAVFTGFWNTSAVVTGLQLFPATGSVSSGTMKIYGIS